MCKCDVDTFSKCNVYTFSVHSLEPGVYTFGMNTLESGVYTFGVNTLEFGCLHTWYLHSRIWCLFLHI